MSTNDESHRPAISAEQTEAFVREFGKVQHGLRTFILSLVIRWDDADEIFQKTSLIVWRKFAEFDPNTDFRKWACQVAYYEVLKWRQQRHCDNRVELTEDVIERLADDLVKDNEYVDARQQALVECLESLRAADRKLVQLRYLADNSVQGVAKEVGRSTDAVYKAINRIRWTLLECIQRRLRGEGTLP